MMHSITLVTLVAERTLEPRLAALLWLLAEGGVPVVITGMASLAERSTVATAILAAVPGRAWVVRDADADRLTTEQLAALVRGGVGLGLTLAAVDLRDLLSRLSEPPVALPEDAVRRLGVVLVVEGGRRGVRVRSAHYLRPTERDAQGHLQRRPPAVLATWDPETDTFDDFAWGITPELADRVDRSQADLEDRQRDRGAFLVRLAAGAPLTEAGWQDAARVQLAGEPPSLPAPPREPAKPSPFQGGLIDPDPHIH